VGPERVLVNGAWCDSDTGAYLETSGAFPPTTGGAMLD
jgi:hypothetical protein